MNHYYENNINLTSNIKELKYTYKGKNILFKTDNGVFSKNHIDFGTNVLLNSLCDFNDGCSVLDVGCGYGVIGLCIAKAYEKVFVDMVDVNERAVSLVKENIRYNDIKNANAFVSNTYENVLKEYDYIISNPPIRAGKKVVFDIVESGNEHLKKGGKIFVVIQKKQGAPSLYIKMNEVYGNAEIINKEKGYHIIMSVKG